MRFRSLSSRLIAYWFVGSLFAFFSVPVTVDLPLAAIRFGNRVDTNLEAWTTMRARNIVADSLRRGEDGSKYIEMTDALRLHLRRNPNLKFAAFDADTGVAFSGSSPELTEYLKVPNGFQEDATNFRIVGDPNSRFRGFAWTTDTPTGRARVAVYGTDFHWDDVFYQLYYYLRLETFLSYLPLFCVMSISAVVAMRRGFAPLREISHKISAIDLNSLNQHISSTELPTEIVPIVDAMNSAFARLDDGVARERRFTANSAHELRTPITILNSHVEKMQTSPLKFEIQRDVRRIRTIVEQMLVLAQLSERKFDMTSPPELDLVGAVRTIVANYAPIALDNDRNLELDAPPTPVFVRAYRWALESVITNLLENAVRAEPPDGTILVKILPDATIAVIDHGRGIGPSEQEKIFEPFWRKDDSSPGTGLGLSIVRELLDKMGGTILVMATPGGGATFRIHFAHCGVGQIFSPNATNGKIPP